MRLTATLVDVETKAFFDGIRARLTDMTPAMSMIGQTVRASILRNFDQGGRPEHWRPLAIATIKASFKKSDFTKGGRLSKKGNSRLQGGAPLTNTGRLRNSINARAFPDRVEIGPAGGIPYAAIHQFGGLAGKGHKVRIPARPYLMVQDEDWKMIREQLMAYWVPGWK